MVLIVDNRERLDLELSHYTPEPARQPALALERMGFAPGLASPAWSGPRPLSVRRERDVLGADWRVL